MKVPLIEHTIKQSWWRNFCHGEPARYGELDNFQKALAPYNCRYVRRMWPKPDYIEFDTEQDYVMFVLRWS